MADLVGEHGKNCEKVFVFCMNVATTASEDKVKATLLSDRRSKVEEYLGKFIGNTLQSGGHSGKMGLKDNEYGSGRYAQIKVSVLLPEADPDLMRCRGGEDIKAIV